MEEKMRKTNIIAGKLIRCDNGDCRKTISFKKADGYEQILYLNVK